MSMKYSRDLFPDIESIDTRRRDCFPEIEATKFWEFYEICKHFSLLHAPGFYNIYQSMRYLEKNRLNGCVVECGCFLGGAAAFIGLMRKELRLNLDIWLFDTFEGPPIGSTDVFVGGSPIETPELLPNYQEQVKLTIKEIVGTTRGYKFVAGLVEDTVPVASFDEIALLRLDTDFYSSTKVELEILYPKLIAGGVLIIDDYGTFKGSRKATDEYLSGLEVPPLLNRIDQGIWSGVKPDTGSDEMPSDKRRANRWLSRLSRR